MSAKLTLAALLQEHWDDYERAHRSQLNRVHYRAVRRVLQCRTHHLGGSLYRCSSCQTPHFSYHSCNHRNCPQCGALDQQLWSAKQEANLLPIPYFLVTFTIPDSLRTLCLAHPKAIYQLLLKESAGALRDIVDTKTGADRVGITSVLHTWGRQMQHHPHVHCIVPAIGYNSETGGLVHPKQADEFFVHFLPLAPFTRPDSLVMTERAEFACVGPVVRPARAASYPWHRANSFAAGSSTFFPKASPGFVTTAFSAVPR